VADFSGNGFNGTERIPFSLSSPCSCYNIDMNRIPISRRHFAELIAAGAAAAFVRPTVSLAKPAVTSTSHGFVRLSANENPYGPSPKALQALQDAAPLVCRYPDEHADQLIERLAKMNGVAPDEILLGDGSGEILKLCAEAFTGNNRGNLVAADPTFEAILKHAAMGGAEVVKVSLTNSFAHDLPKMLNAAKGGLIYICNPNNPTASITPKNELREFVTKTPAATMILVDEAYFHFADSPDYESVIPLIEDHPNLMVARTFSKIYAMAGLRCGYCVAQKETIAKLRSHQPWDSVNIMALAAAGASLDDLDQVPNGQRLNREAKGYVVAQLEKSGYRSIPSQANFIMIDVHRPVVPLIDQLKQRGVEVGRLFPAMPDHMRVTIGKKSEMETFLSAFRTVTV
jgi:histidinol-phosphate aminotransferase